MNEPAIKIDNLVKTYGDFVAVDRISLQVEKGEIFGLLGPNGAGKTSILECIEGLRDFDGGSIKVMGMDPLKDAKRMKDVVGIQLQSSGLPETITVKEAMKLFSAYHGVEPRYDILKKMGLLDELNTQYKALSGGYQKKLVLAIAVIHKPKLLVLDEPTAALDVQSRVELHKLMNDLRDEGTTILLATHDMAEAEKMGDRIAIILKGKLVCIGSPKEITSSGSTSTKISVRTVGASLKDTEGIEICEYYIFYSDTPGKKVMEIINIIETKGDSLIDLRVERPSLEERFIEITSGGAK